MTKLRPLLTLLYNPSRGMTEIAAEAPYLAAAVLALAASILYRGILAREFLRAFQTINNTPNAPGMVSPGAILVSQLFKQVLAAASPLFFLSAVFVPACIFAANLFDRRASFGVRLRLDFASLLSCALYAWAAAYLVMLIPAAVIYHPGGPNPQLTIAVLSLAPLPYFIFLMVVGVHAALRLGFGISVGAVALGGCSLVALPFLTGVLAPLLSSPFILIFVILLLRNVLGDVLGQQRSREAFKRHLETATLNPADASAHYNLGLIYQQRGQIDEARSRFQRAVEIDPNDVDSHYQLGRIARQQKQLAEAIQHFDAVVQRDEAHSQNEVWREIGATYSEAGQYADAAAALERFLARRPSDAEGRFRHGLALARLGRESEAEAEMQACIEAARSAPAYKYRSEKRWMNEAEGFLRSQAGNR